MNRIENNNDEGKYLALGTWCYAYTSVMHGELYKPYLYNNTH
jgi:hypothetical protein